MRCSRREAAHARAWGMTEARPVPAAAAPVTRRPSASARATSSSRADPVAGTASLHRVTTWPRRSPGPTGTPERSASSSQTRAGSSIQAASAVREERRTTCRCGGSRSAAQAHLASTWVSAFARAATVGATMAPEPSGCASQAGASRATVHSVTRVSGAAVRCGSPTSRRAASVPVASTTARALRAPPRRRARGGSRSGSRPRSPRSR